MRPRIRQQPEDFRVEEIPLFEPAGEGGHLYVEVEKRLRDSEHVARELARALGVAPRDVGMAGRKDRRAVTRQWYSLPGVDARAALALSLDGVRVLRAVHHRHKLRTGQLRGNRFEIRVRGVGAEDEAGARAALGEILQRGMSNRFGRQRFGRAGANPERARTLLTGERRARDRRSDRFLLSALQAEVFNRVLEARPLALDDVESGDVARVEVSGGLFLVEDVARERERAQRFEISATGPIFGSKMFAPAGRPAERERAALQAAGVPDAAAWRLPRGLRLPGARRPLRVRLDEATLRRDEEDLVLRFSLPAGSYATVLLETLFGELDEAGAAPDARL